MNTTPASLLEVDLEVERRQVTVRAGFALQAGERLAIFGTSGAGKTTILESIAGLTRLSRGNVRIDGELVAGRAKGETALEPRHRQVALVRQPTTLFPHLTVEQNVAYGIRLSPARGRVRSCSNASVSPHLPERVGPPCPGVNGNAWPSGGRSRAHSRAAARRAALGCRLGGT